MASSELSLSASLDAHELAWAAGFFDGEGSCGAYALAAGKGRQIRLAISQNERSTLDRFQLAVGVGRVYERTTTDNTPFSYQATSFENVQAVIALLWAFLSKPKRRQARQTLKEYESRARR